MGPTDSTSGSTTSTPRSTGEEITPPGPEHLAEVARRFLLDDPPQDAQFERYISPDEYGAVMVPCLNDQGIPARHSGDGGVLYGHIPEEQALLQREALYRCEVRFPTHPRYFEPLNAEQLGRLYVYLVEDLVSCLETEGYNVSSPPTLEVFIGSFNDPAVPSWHPYPAGDPRIQQPEEWNRLNTACPQFPPLDELYGTQ